MGAGCNHKSADVMSNYPDDAKPACAMTVETVCTGCKYQWEAAATYDQGNYSLINEADGQCPNCGKWDDDK